MKKAFTIVELLVVVAILGVLMTMVFVSVKGSLADARDRRAEALCKTVQAGLASYHVLYDEWPEPLAGKVRSGSFSDTNEEGEDRRTDPEKYVLKADEVRKMVKALVDEAKKGNPLMDVSGLFVSRATGEPGTRGTGYDFTEAVRGSNRNRKKMNTAEMYFGYAEREKGYFRRFKMVYSVPGDSLTVSKQ